MDEQEAARLQVDLQAIAQERGGPTPLWPGLGEDLHVNVLALDPDATIAEHVNQELDVLLVGIRGGGTVTVEGHERQMAAGQALLLPKGMRRRISAGPSGFAYLTCHRLRALLWPRGAPRP